MCWTYADISCTSASFCSTACAHVLEFDSIGSFQYFMMKFLFAYGFLYVPDGIDIGMELNLSSNNSEPSIAWLRSEPSITEMNSLIGRSAPAQGSS